MNRVRALDRAGANLTVEAGLTLAAAQTAANDAGLYFPLSLASEGSATIGGNLSTNAGGVHVLRYGMARELVLGLEVVLADGRVLEMLRSLRKDNTGYDLKQIFIGAEGTLGVITAATLKLFPKPDETVTAFVAVRSPAEAVALLSALQKATGGLISAFELLPQFGVRLVIEHVPGTRNPLGTPSDWYVLLEAASGANFPIEEAIETALSVSGLASDAAIARSEAQRTEFWKLRESMSEAQKKEGASLKHDIAVPVASIAVFIETATAAVLKAVPGARPVTFGHLGDGNLHFNFNAPKDSDGRSFLARRADVARLVHDRVRDFGGSFSAEHGIGVMKRDELVRYKSAEEIEIMRALKRMLDPNNILNPGKVV
jgi:FAD/FMN-containing dehydrogenase